jgi:hypothetical protein
VVTLVAKREGDRVGPRRLLGLRAQLDQLVPGLEEPAAGHFADLVDPPLRRPDVDAVWDAEHAAIGGR